MELRTFRTVVRRIARGWPVALGALGGYVYYATVGCMSGSCPITSNPWISTAYGALIGVFLIPRRRTAVEKSTTNPESAEHPGNSPSA